ncbi:LysR family transcriptional regulator [Nocardia stercoris]|uniref:LysR family transcriptional regulator n=1 Tax=Nocardia stercoris TaxID=2483361 RepID=A0A3M2L6D3_9NOCA|nr:LysR family transcriptional regulator [Nocardia stercoris]
MLLSQPRVSQIVRELERAVGGPLFLRSSRRVEPTPLGRELLAGVTPALRDIDRAVLTARSAARGLRIGFLGPFASTLDEPIAALRHSRPEMTVQLVQAPWVDSFAGLYNGELDLLLYLSPVVEPDLVTGPTVRTYPRMVAVARNHPLAARTELTVEDLGDTGVVGPPDRAPEATVRAYWPPERTPSGRPIRRIGSARTEAEMLSAVARGDGVYVTSTAMPAHFAHPAVDYLPITGLPPARAVLVWHRNNACDRVHRFASLAQDRDAGRKYSAPAR